MGNSEIPTKHLSVTHAVPATRWMTACLQPNLVLTEAAHPWNSGATLGWRERGNIFQKVQGKKFPSQSGFRHIFFLFFFFLGMEINAEGRKFLSKHNKLFRVNSWDFLLA